MDAVPADAFRRPSLAWPSRLRHQLLVLLAGVMLVAMAAMYLTNGINAQTTVAFVGTLVRVAEREHCSGALARHQPYLSSRHGCAVFE